MNTIEHVLIGQPYTVPAGPGFTGLEIVRATGTLTVRVSGASGGTFKMRQGDTLHYDRDWLTSPDGNKYPAIGYPENLLLESDTNPDPIEIRVGKGWSFSLANALQSIINLGVPLPVSLMGDSYDLTTNSIPADGAFHIVNYTAFIATARRILLLSDPASGQAVQVARSVAGASVAWLMPGVPFEIFSRANNNSPPNSFWLKAPISLVDVAMIVEY